MIRYYFSIPITFTLFFILASSVLANSSKVNTNIEVFNNGSGSSTDISVQTNTGGNYVNEVEIPQKSKTHIEVNGKSYDYEDAGSVSVKEHNGNTEVKINGKSNPIVSNKPEIENKISQVQKEIKEAKKAVKEKKKEVEKKVEEQRNAIQTFLDSIQQLFKKFF